MPKVRTTLTLEEEILRAVKVKAARTGIGDSELIEKVLRRDLGMDVIEQQWALSRLGEEEAMSLAQEAQTAARKR
jgi:hypothetical protein